MDFIIFFLYLSYFFNLINIKIHHIIKNYYKYRIKNFISNESVGYGVASARRLLLSDTILSTNFAEDLLHLLLLSLLSPLFVTERCKILTGMPPISKSSFNDLVKNLRSVSDSLVFPLKKATNVGGRAFT